jgi:hypothetical protein
MASKVVVGIAIGCGVVLVAGIAIVGVGGWYVKKKVTVGEIFVEFAVSSSPTNAQSTLDTAANETLDQFPSDPNVGSIGIEPSYLRLNNDSGAFFAWTRSGYYFSANAKNGQQALDAFMQAFPY